MSHGIFISYQIPINSLWRPEVFFYCDTFMASSYHKMYSRTPIVLCHEGQNGSQHHGAQVSGERGLLPLNGAEFTWRRCGRRRRRGAGASLRNQRPFLLSFCLGPRHMGSTQAGWVHTEGERLPQSDSLLSPCSSFLSPCGSLCFLVVVWCLLVVTFCLLVVFFFVSFQKFSVSL